MKTILLIAIIACGSAFINATITRHLLVQSPETVRSFWSEIFVYFDTFIIRNFISPKF